VLACTTACTTQSCVDTCTGAASTAALPYLNAINTCLGTHCLPDGGTQCTMGSATMACRTCVATNCMTQIGACQTH
jgi:hypothetical protein